MWGEVCLRLAFLQVGLVAGWGLRAEHSTASWSEGFDPRSSSPITWTTHLAGAGTAEPAPTMACRGEEDCPPWSRCEPQAGRSSCRCGLGYHLSPTLGCVPARAFPARLLLHDPQALGKVEEEPYLPWLGTRIQGLFQYILEHIGGYLGSSTHNLKWPSEEVIVVHHFSARAPVTAHQVEAAVAVFRMQCRDGSHGAPPACALLSHVAAYQSLSLCHFGICDSLSTSCSFQDGLVRCTCRPGYLQAHAMDRTCTACNSGFWLRNGTCARCPFGFSGTGCQEPFLLALVIVSGVGGLLLLLLLLLAAGCLSGRARHTQEPSGTPELPLHSSALSLPRVRPPWTVREAEGGTPGSRAPLSLWDPDGGPPVGDTPPMKTFLGSPRSPASAPQPQAGCSNFVFVSDGEEWGKRSYF